MDIRKTVTAALTKDDIEAAIKGWMRLQGWSVIDTNFEMTATCDGEDLTLEGATCMVKQADHDS